MSELTKGQRALFEAKIEKLEAMLSLSEEYNAQKDAEIETLRTLHQAALDNVDRVLPTTGGDER